jgi:hypothetical protein
MEFDTLVVVVVVVVVVVIIIRLQTGFLQVAVLIQ